MKRFSLIAVTALSAVAAFAQPKTYLKDGVEIPLYLYEDAPVEERVQDALCRMTLFEKCRLSYAQSKFSSPGVPRLGIPELWYSDGPHGVRAEINWNNWGYAEHNNDSITAFPALTCLAATWNPELAHLYGNSVGQEARYRRKTVLLGPGVNIYRTPLGGRNFEYMGEDPYLASTMVVPYIKGIQENGVAACVKHYILNDQEEFRGHVDVKVSERAFNEIYLPPFKAAVKEAGVLCVMGSYNRYHGQHVSHNDILLNKVLKQDLGFKGVVVSDWGATHNTDEAIFNGLDSEMGSYTNGLTSEGKGFGYDDYYLGRAYYEKCLKGEVPDSIVNDKAARILRVIFSTQRSHNLLAPNGRLGSAEQLSAARRIADEGIVLLKNNMSAKTKAPLLPIDPNRCHRILVVGENATRSLCMGGGSSELKTKVEVSPLQGLIQRYPKGVQIDYAMGYKSGPSMYGRIEKIDAAVEDSLRNDAVNQARNADLVIYIGGLNKNHFSDCEGGDRLTYDLGYGQNELINALLDVNPNMVCVIISGNAFRMPWLNRVPALVQSWYLGSMAGLALTDILSGDVNPSGKTIFSYPATLEDCPAHQLGRISYPGAQPSEIPAAFTYGKEENPSSAKLLSVATKPNGLREEGKKLGASLLKRNDSDDTMTHWGNNNEVELYAEDILVGYRWYDYQGTNAVNGKNVIFPFGYGLSYTQFKYSTPALFDNTISVLVKNVGNVAGKETVQFYIGDDKASVIRPRKELKYFEKIELQPGEVRSVNYTINENDMNFYDEKTHEWIHENGNFTIYVCSSSAEVLGKITITR